MFLGEYTPTLDEKGRLTLPAKFREQLETAYLTSEVDQCLALWPPEEFAARARELRDQAKRDGAAHDRAAYFFAGAQEVVPDKQGRIAIPSALREFAGLQGPVVVTGFFDHVEIRASGPWQAKKARGAEGMARLQFQGE
ncbi:MAG TPA: division/cell wall cluster transcriptional repressor MraZ [Acidimicrobiales bacterium]|jgi:MraZ protein|nr:division/cell wall cluster transcriptional repressor MraZ [Acidimicrobiales bacterium]